MSPRTRDKTPGSPNIWTGGKAIYGASVGILMLEAQFPRIPGDMGNALTWPFPVHYQIVHGASPDLVVRRKADGLLDAFIEAARMLAASGVDGITTNCGFLSIFQRELQSSVDIPVAASSLMQVPLIERMLPPKRHVGIITISQDTLSGDHLKSAGVAPNTPVVGTDRGTELTRVILNDEPSLDVEAARADMLDAAERLVRDHPGIGAIVLECTNMVPYAADLKKRFQLPVFSAYSFVTWFQSGLAPRPFA
jgi:Asp/Glu/hydantoin racemase